VPYKLSEAEARLYKEVTEYVREEFNRTNWQALERCGHDGQRKRVAHMPTATKSAADR
jgi:hypothetical protein